MLADLFLSVADAVISYTIDKLDPAETLKTWLKRDPAKLAFQKALARTYAAFARQYPEYAASLFDQSFLNKEAIPELSKLLIRSQHPDPALLAQVWGTSIGFDPHSEFCKRATKPASDFLTWLEAELKAEQAFQALFDSRALDSLPRIEAEIEKLTKELTRGRDAALKIASEYERITLKVQGDIKDSNVILGDGNQINVSNIYNTYYTGAFDRLNDFYVPPDGVFQRVRVDEFVGRDWLTAKVDAFLNDPSRKSGAFLLIGEAGVGKTSFMAHLVKERRYLHLFAEQVAGDANLQRALQSLGSQLVTRYQIDPYKDRDTLTQLAVFPDFLERLLRLAASTLTNGEKIVIVCDALDEAGTFPDGNVFGLPNVLPDGVYFILSQRPVNTKLPNFEALRFNLEAQGADNLQDMQTYLGAVAKRPEVAGQIRSKEYSEAFFIQTLKEKSLGVWMYLHYIIKEIESGSRAPLDLENLPTGLTGYYADYWDDWRYGHRGRGKGEEAWNNLYSPLLTTLAAAQEAITVDQLIQWADVKANPREVAHLLNQSWRSFITEKEIEKNKVYSPYHLSFRDFITGKVDFEKLDPKRESLVHDLAEQTVEAHRRIAKAFEEECKGEWEKLVAQDYPRLHLSAHLAGAGQYEKLFHLLTEGKEHIKWAEAKCSKEETYTGYLNDIEFVWNLANQDQNHLLAIRCMLIENSIHSLASNIPSVLLNELAKEGIWSYVRCLEVIRQKTEPEEQSKSIVALADSLPMMLIDEALSIAAGIKADSARAHALSSVVPYINNELKIHVLYLARETKSESAQVRIFLSLIPHLERELQTQVIQETLEAAYKIYDEYACASALSMLMVYLNELQKEESLRFIREFQYASNQLRVLSAFAPHLNKKNKDFALKHVRDIFSKQNRISALSILALQLSGKEREMLSEEAISLVSDNSSKEFRVKALSILAPHLNIDLKMKILEDIYSVSSESEQANILSTLAANSNSELSPRLFSIANNIVFASTRARALLSLAPYFEGDLKSQTVQATLSAALKSKDANVQASVLVSFGSHLNDKQQEEILSAIRKIKHSLTYFQLITDIAPQINETTKKTILDDALRLAREIHDGSDKALALSFIARHLSGELKLLVLNEALVATRRVKDELERAGAYSSFFPYLMEENKKSALSFIMKIEQEQLGVSLLVKILPQLDKTLKKELLKSLQEIKSEAARTRILLALAPHVYEDIEAQVLKIAFKIPTTKAKTQVLVALVPHISDTNKASVASYLFELANQKTMNNILPFVLPHLSSGQISELLMKAYDVKKTSQRNKILIVLIPYLDNEQRLSLLKNVLEVKSEFNSAFQLLSYLAPHIPKEFEKKAFDAAQNIPSLISKADALLSIFRYVGDDLKPHVFQCALSTIKNIKPEIDRVRSVVKLASCVDNVRRDEALKFVDKVTRKNNRAYALSAFAPYLSENQITEILSTLKNMTPVADMINIILILIPFLNKKLITQAFTLVNRIEEESDRMRVLSAFFPYLDDAMLKKVLSALHGIRVESIHIRMLTSIAPYLSDVQKLEELAVIDGVGSRFERTRVRTFIALVPHLSKKNITQALSTARNIKSKFTRAKALSAFVNILEGDELVSLLKELLFISDELDYSIIFNTWRKLNFSELDGLFFLFLKHISQMRRSRGVNVVGALTLPAIHLLGKPITDDLYKAVEDTARWWP